MESLSQMRPQQDAPGDQSDKNRQQYRCRAHIFRPTGKFVILRANTVNHRLNRTVEDFNDHHQHHGTNQQHAGNGVDVQPAGDGYAQQYGNAFLAECLRPACCGKKRWQLYREPPSVTAEKDSCAYPMPIP